MQIPHLTASKINQAKKQRAKSEGRAQKLLCWLLEIGTAKISAALSSMSGFAQPWRHRGGDTAPLVTVCRGPGVFEQKMQTLLNSELFLLVGIFIPFSLFLDSGSSASNRAGDSTWGSGQVCCETKTNKKLIQTNEPPKKSEQPNPTKSQTKHIPSQTRTQPNCSQMCVSVVGCHR